MKPSWQQEWENAVAAGRQEGKVLIYTTSGSALRTPVGSAFKEKFGIDIDWAAVVAGEIVAKVSAEHTAGLDLTDLVISGVTDLTELSKGGISAPIEPALLLPEVKDPKAWKDGILYFQDKEGTIFVYYCRAGSTILVNSEMVKPEDLKSYRNLLDLKWKGKIILNDPTIAGAGNSLLATLNVLMGTDFLRKLATQEPVVDRDQRLQIEWLARGKYPILLGPYVGGIADFRNAGAPIKHIVPEEGTWSGAGGGNISLVKKAAHPQAAKVFLNWYLSQEGQTVAVKGEQEQSRRLDVSAEYIDPDRRLQPGVKYVDGDTSEAVARRLEMRVLSKEIFAAQLK